MKKTILINNHECFMLEIKMAGAQFLSIKFPCMLCYNKTR